MIDYEKKIVVIHPPRCGGTTAEHVITGQNLFRTHPFEKHLNAFETAYHLRALGYDPDAFRWIGLVRHPLERACSMYRAGYWTEYTRFPMQSRRAVSAVQFVALLRPAYHERDNFLLCDYHNREAMEFLSIESLGDFLLQEYDHPRGRRAEVNQGPPFSPSALFVAVVEWRFRKDYRRFSFSRSSPYGRATLWVGALTTFLYRAYESFARRFWRMPKAYWEKRRVAR